MVEVEGWDEELGAVDGRDNGGEDDMGVGVGRAFEKGTGETVGWRDAVGSKLAADGRREGICDSEMPLVFSTRNETDTVDRNVPCAFLALNAIAVKV
jgi:hypothetical protein